MNSIDIHIPMADGQRIQWQVLYGISKQTIRGNIVPITRPRNDVDKRISEAECRNIGRRYATCDKLAFVIDRTAVFTSVFDIEDAIEAISARLDYDALAYNIKRHKDSAALIFDEQNKHIEIGCMIVRTDVLRRVTFRSLTPGDCLCVAFNQDAKIGWVDHRQLREVKV